MVEPEPGQLLLQLVRRVERTQQETRAGIARRCSAHVLLVSLLRGLLRSVVGDRVGGLVALLHFEDPGFGIACRSSRARRSGPARWGQVAGSACRVQLGLQTAGRGARLACVRAQRGTVHAPRHAVQQREIGGITVARCVRGVSSGAPWRNPTPGRRGPGGSCRPPAASKLRRLGAGTSEPCGP